MEKNQVLLAGIALVLALGLFGYFFVLPSLAGTKAGNRVNALVPAGSTAGAAASGPNVIVITSRQYSFSPDAIALKKGVPVVIELRTEDVAHSLVVSELGLSVRAEPGQPGRVQITPEKTGTFSGFCRVYCGGGHAEMGVFVKVE